MPVEFDPPAPVESSSPAAGEVPVESSDEVLAAPRGVRRSRVIAGTAVAVVVIAGAITVGLTESSASASPASLAAAAASSSAPGATGSAPARPSGPAGRGAFQPGPPFIFGTVKSVSGTTIKVTDQQGFTRTIVTSSKTTYKGGATATPAVGAKIIATGTVDANGTSLDATTISALPAAGASGARSGGFGAPGGRGFGGPGGHGPGGPRPTGPATGDFHPGERGKPGPTSAAPTPAPTTPTPSK